MEKTKTFKNLINLQKVKDLSVIVCKLMESFLDNKKFGLVGQRRFLLFSIILFIFCFLFSDSAIAVSVYWQAPMEVGIEQEFMMSLMLDPIGEELNAIEGRVVIPEQVKLISVNSGNSFVNLWLENPSFSKDQEIKFSGIIPGGYLGELGPFWQGYQPGEIFRIMVKPLATGLVEFFTDDFSVLLNNGLGTEAKLNLKTHLLVIKPEIQAPREFGPEDKTPPEKFVPEVLRDENLFNGQWVLIFSSQDKGSGISHYEILELSSFLWQRIFGSHWQTTQASPYLLKDQSLKSLIKIRAVDNSGNQTEVFIEPKEKIYWYQDPSYWGVIIICAIMALLSIKNAFRFFGLKH